MDSFFLPLVAAALAEWGDKTQILAVLLAVRFQRPALVLTAIACAALANAVLAAFGGQLLAGFMDGNSSRLFLAVAFALAGVSAFIPYEEPDAKTGWKVGAFLTSLFAFMAIELGDKTQFVTAGFAAMLPLWPFVAIGAAIGVIAACAPAVMMGEVFRERFPLKLIRRISGGVFLLVASILAISALRLI